MRKTRIVCTIGPASQNPDVLEKLIRLGMDVARLNFSHGTKEEHRQVLAYIRSISKDLGKQVAILQDLPGPKLRIGDIPGGELLLSKGDIFTLTMNKVGGVKGKVSVNYSSLIQDVRIGDTILLADGSIHLEVIAKRLEEIDCRVIIGGVLSSRKGINVPVDTLSIPAFTKEDEEALLWGIEQEVDFVALSFVRQAEDLKRAREILGKKGSPIHLIAKIEKGKAVENLDEIIKAADGIMIARGDLGVEIPIEKIPVVQKELIKKANAVGKPVITATQMLKSMVDNTMPTRAEVADVANAVLDGSDAVMLSEETAVGKYPGEVVHLMSDIIRETETTFQYWKNLRDMAGVGDMSIEEAISHAGNDIAYYLQARAIITLTESGLTARLISKNRPGIPILAFTRHPSTQRQLQLSWGIHSFIVPGFSNLEDTLRQVKGIALQDGWVCPDDIVICTSGLPLQEPGNTNLIKVDRI